MKTAAENVKAVDAYIAAHARADELIVQLGEEVEAAMDSVNPDDVNWGNVGDINHVNEMLADIIKFVTGS